MHDYVGRVYSRRYSRIDPEARLIIAYPATLLLFVALLVLGFALQHQWHYMVLAVFSAVQCVGLMIVTTAINAYLLDSYPEGSGEVGAWITAGRNWGGFMVTYIQIEWVLSAGPAKAFGAQAGITIASMLILVFLQLFGKRIRRIQGRMVFSR
jgi:MFS family permease